MSSFGTLVASIGLPAGIISIVVAVAIFAIERLRRGASLRKIEQRKSASRLKLPGLQQDDQGNIRLMPPDESIRRIKVQDYVADARLSQQVDNYLRPVKDLRRLRNILQSRDQKTPERERLRGSTLSHVDLRRLELSLIDFSRADLRNADLRHAVLKRVYLRNADLTSADLRGADLRDADLKGANLRRADLTDALLTQEQIEVAIGDDQTKLPSALKHPQGWEHSVRSDEQGSG